MTISPTKALAVFILREDKRPVLESFIPFSEALLHIRGNREVHT